MSRIIRLGQKIEIGTLKGKVFFYPNFFHCHKKIKLNDVLSIGFDNLKVKVVSTKSKLICRSFQRAS